MVRMLKDYPIKILEKDNNRRGDLFNSQGAGKGNYQRSNKKIGEKSPRGLAQIRV